MYKSNEALMSLMVNAALLAHPRKAAVVFSVLRARANLGAIALPDIDAKAIDALTGRPRAGSSQFYGQQPEARPGSWERREPYRLDQGVAIITATGSMVNRGAWVGDDGSGLMSYEGFKYQLSRVAQDARAHSVILDIETPGGQATGAFEMARAVRDVASVKPVYAVVNGIAASGGYAMASGATRIITTPSGLSGSIGVVMLHLDESEKLLSEGVKPTLIFAGAHKVDGNGVEPLTDDVRADLQQEVQETYDLFIDTVAKGRGDRLTKAKARATEARTFMGKAAVQEGLADDVGTFEEVLHEAQGRARKAQARGSKSGGTQAMSVLGNDDQGSAPGTSANNGKTHTAADIEAARTAGQEAGTKAANDRLAAIMGNPKVKGRESAALALATENPGMSADAVANFVEQHVPAGGQQAAGGGSSAGEGGETGQRRTVADRTGPGSEVGKVHQGPIHNDPAKAHGQTSGEDKAVKDGWAAAREKQKASFEAGNRHRMAGGGR